MSDRLEYQHGLGNALQSEALVGALPARQNSPKSTPFGLYAEQLNGTGFTVERSLNLRTWMYRLRPQISTQPWTRLPPGRLAGGFDKGTSSPELMRFAPLAFPDESADFLSSLTTFAGAGDPTTRTGMAIHLYSANADMVDRAFVDNDGDLLIVPQYGRLLVKTELGLLEVRPGEIAIMPRGIRFSVCLPDGRARGFVSEVFNGHHQLPNRGLVGANGLADERHFKAPVAAYEDDQRSWQIVAKSGGDLWATTQEHSPFDVVAWHGTYAPFKYSLLDFAPHWGALYDHSDPSIFTVLSVPHDDHGRNALDFGVFRGRWDATEHTFRPPYFHRNSAIEFNAVIKSRTTAGPYVAGAHTYTPYLAAHGVSAAGYRHELEREEGGPHRLSDDELWVQWESTYPLRVLPWVLDAKHRDTTFNAQFEGFRLADDETA